MKAKSHRGFQRCLPETGSRSYYVVFIWLTTRPHLRDSDFYDPAAWFKPLLEHANMVFKRYLTPKGELSIDESFIGTKARSVMTQYIPSKSSKLGIKIWMLVQAATVISFTLCHTKVDGMIQFRTVSYMVVS